MLGLRLKNPDNLDLDTFCRFLIPIIVTRALDPSKLNRERVNAWNDYLSKIQALDSAEVTVCLVLEHYFRHLKVNKSINNSEYTITGNTNIKFPGTDVLVDSLAALINEGNLEMIGYPVFDEIYSDVKDRVPKLYKIWRGI